MFLSRKSTFVIVRWRGIPYYKVDFDLHSQDDFVFVFLCSVTHCMSEVTTGSGLCDPFGIYKVSEFIRFHWFWSLKLNFVQLPARQMIFVDLFL